MMRTFGWCALVLLTAACAACESAAEPEGAVVDVTKIARAHIEQILVDASAGVWFNARFSDGLDPPHLAFSGWLAGRPEGYAAHVSLATTQSGTFEPFCSSDGGAEDDGFWKQHDVCSRLRIDGDRYMMDLYYTERPHRLPDDRHELRYPAEIGPAGTVVYEPNPLTTWRYTFHGASLVVEADLDVRLRFLPEGGSEIVLDHQGEIRGSLDAAETVVTTSVDLEFPGATECAVPLRAVVIDDGDEVSGEITCGTTVVARIRHPGDQFVFDWIEP